MKNTYEPRDVVIHHMISLDELRSSTNVEMLIYESLCMIEASMREFLVREKFIPAANADISFVRNDPTGPNNPIQTH